MKQNNVKPAEGKLGILVVGNGAVATTFMTGVLMTRKGLTKPIGAMTQYDKIRVILYSDAGMYILRMHTKVLCIVRYSRKKISIL